MATKTRGKGRKSAGKRMPVHAFKPEDSVGYLLRITSRSFNRAFRERIEQEGVNIGMWFYLRALWEEDGLTQRELSQRVGTMDPSTGLAIAKMERQGLIYRKTVPSDQRKRYIYLSPRAKRLRTKLIRHAIDLHEFTTEGLTKEQVATLRTVLHHIRERLKEDDARRSSG